MNKETHAKNQERVSAFWEAGDDVLFDTKTTALILNIKPRTLWIRRKKGCFISYIKTAQKILYRKKDICDYLELNKIVIKSES